MEQLFDDLEDFGAFDDAISGDVRDPYTELARLRREEPVQRLETSGALPHEESLPMFIVYRHEDVQQMLRDNETFSSSAVIAAFGPVLGEGVMLGMDEPIHGRRRSLISKAFSQKALARWEDELVGRVANGLIDKFAPNGKADLVKEFTFDYPSQIIAGLLGLPEKDYPQFQRWSISLLSWLMNPERGLAASAALISEFGHQVLYGLNLRLKGVDVYVRIRHIRQGTEQGHLIRAGATGTGAKRSVGSDSIRKCGIDRVARSQLAGPQAVEDIGAHWRAHDGPRIKITT